jgi:hypothetical protein
MTTTTPTGEPPAAPAPDDAEHQLLAAQVEIVMAAQPLELAAQMLAAAVAASERALASLPDEATAHEIRKAWTTHNTLVALFARPLVQRAADINKFANQLRAAADLRIRWPD